MFQGLRRFKGLNHKAAAAYVENTNYFATLMLATAQADALVSGAACTASSALRPILQIIPRHEQISHLSSLNIFDLEDPDSGKDRELFMADCAVIPEPTSEQLCDIAVTGGSELPPDQCQTTGRAAELQRKEYFQQEPYRVENESRHRDGA